jgi:hypothetical protein
MVKKNHYGSGVGPHQILIRDTPPPTYMHRGIWGMLRIIFRMVQRLTKSPYCGRRVFMDPVINGEKIRLGSGVGPYEILIRDTPLPTYMHRGIWGMSRIIFGMVQRLPKSPYCNRRVFMDPVINGEKIRLGSGVGPYEILIRDTPPPTYMPYMG